MERRRFFGYALGGLVLAGGGMAVLRASGYRVPEGVQLRRLKAWHYVVLNAAGARLIAPAKTDIAAFADGALDNVKPSDRKDLFAMLGYLEHVAPLTHGWRPRFTALGPKSQDRILAALAESPIFTLRAGFQALKALSMMAHYRREEVWAEIGYSGPVVRWSK
jgi:hypothetical protein